MAEKIIRICNDGTFLSYYILPCILIISQRRTKHQNIIQLIEVYEGSDKRIYMVLELASGKELFERIISESFDEKEAVRNIKMILQVILERNLEFQNFYPLTEFLQRKILGLMKYSGISISSQLGNCASRLEA